MLSFWIGKHSLRKLAEVVGSNLTLTIFIKLVNYCIELDLIWEVVGQKRLQCH
jgi:hypothetical protein